jgi:hypothetical protein
MSVPAQSGVFSFALQSGQMEDVLDIQVDQFQWYRTRAPRIGLGTMQNQDTFPMETGGPIVPTGAYKSGQFGGGDIELIPRAENTLGLLLYAALGDMESFADQVYDPIAEAVTTATSTGVNTHIFRFHPTNSFFLPWFAARKLVPGRTAADNYGEVYQDCMIGGLRIDIRAAGLLGTTVSIQSRKVSYPGVSDVNAWTYANTTEDSTSAPLSNNGRLLIGGVKYPITQLTIELANQLTTPQQEQIVGSNHPDTFVPLSRNLTMRCVVKWRDPDLYKQILTGSISGTDWDTLPFITDTEGAKEAFEATFFAPANIPGTTEPYMLSIRANKVVMQVDRGGIDLQAGNIISVPYIVTVLEPEAGQDYCRFVLHNDADYAIPEQPVLDLLGTATFDISVGTPVSMDSTVTFTSALTHLNGGRVIAEIISGFQTGDELTVNAIGTITNTAGVIANSATDFGTATGGTGGAPLVIELDTDDATPVAIKALIEAIQFDNAAPTAGTYRTVRISVWNNAGGFVYTDTDLAVVA